MKGQKLGQILIAMNVLDAAKAAEALEYSKAWLVPMGQACVELGFVHEDDIVRAIALQLAAPMVKLEGFDVPVDVLRRVPAKLAAKSRVLPVALTQSPNGGRPTLVIAVARPRSIDTYDEIAAAAQAKVALVVTSDADLDAALVRYYKLDPTVFGGQSEREQVQPGVEHVVAGYFDFVPKS